MSLKAELQTPYLYRIPPAPQLDSETLRGLDLWNALEFFRIEALLRSESVQNLYQLVSQHNHSKPCPADRLKRWKLLCRHVFKRKGETRAKVLSLLADPTLRDYLFIDDGWLVLWGAHHRYLRPDPWLKHSVRHRAEISDGILDLSILAQEGKLDEKALLRYLRQEQQMYFFPRITCAITPEANVKALRRVLQQRHQALTINIGKPNIDPETGEHTFPWHPRKNPPIKDYLAWAKYFLCYDLRKSGLKHEEVSIRIYRNDINAFDKTRLAIKRVENLIRAAEQNDWPPHDFQ